MSALDISDLTPPLETGSSSKSIYTRDTSPQDLYTNILLRPQLLLLPLGFDLPSLTFLTDKRVLVSPRRRWITDVSLLDLIRLDDDYSKVLPGNRIM